MTHLASFADLAAHLAASAIPDAPEPAALAPAPSAPAPAATALAPVLPAASPFPLRVVCVKWKPRHLGTLDGYADVLLPDVGMVVRGIRVKTDSLSNRYALIPGRPDAADPAVWKSVVTFDTHASGEAFSAAVIAALLAVYPDALPSPASQHEGPL